MFWLLLLRARVRVRVPALRLDERLGLSRLEWRDRCGMFCSNPSKKNLRGRPIGLVDEE